MQLVEQAAAAHDAQNSSSPAPGAQDSEESSTTPGDEATDILDQEYQDTRTGEPTDPVDVPEAILDDEDFAGPREPHTEQIAIEFIYWLRLVTSQAHHPHEFARKKLTQKLANLKIQVVECPIPCTEIETWKDLVREIFPGTGEDHIRSKRICLLSS